MARKVPQGLAAEFGTLEELVGAIDRMREHGYRQLDAYTPFPADEVLHALRVRKSAVPLLTLIGGIIGIGIGYGIPSWTNVVDYPLNVGGRPDNAVPAFIPLVFETGVLFAGAFAFFGFLFLCGLPRLWHPVLEVQGFDRATTDRYWLTVAATDPRFALDQTIRELNELEPLRIERYGEPT